MNHDEMAKKIYEELKPELDRQWAEHERIIELVATSQNATDEQKRAFAEHVRKRALGAPKRRFPFVGIAILIAIALLTVVVFNALR